MIYVHTGNCPKCGAPVHSVRERPDGVPAVLFTCECRKTLPAALPDIGEGPEESTAAVDRKIVEGLRTAALGDERVSDA